jgi:hypothetical protein
MPENCAALNNRLATTGEIRNAAAVICLAEQYPLGPAENSGPTPHAALVADIFDTVHGGAPSHGAAPVPAEELSPSGLRHLPTNLTRPEIAGQLSVSLKTVNTTSAASTPSSAPPTGPQPHSAAESYGCWHPVTPDYTTITGRSFASGGPRPTGPPQA